MRWSEVGQIGHQSDEARQYPRCARPSGSDDERHRDPAQEPPIRSEIAQRFAWG